MEVDDLYANLALGDDEQAEDLKFKGKFEKLAKEHERLEDTHHQAAKRLQELEENQGILERNISCMYETALQQVKRKDVIIADLRDQLAAAKAKRNR